MLFSKYKIKIR